MACFIAYYRQFYRQRSAFLARERWLEPIGPLEFSYEMAVSKTNQDGQDRSENFKPVVGEAAAALQAGPQTARIVEDALFRRVGKGGPIGGPLSPGAVRDIVQVWCGIASLSRDFSAHSLRSGFVTEAVRQEVPLAQTMAMTGHRSVQNLMDCARSNGSRRTALRLLEKRTDPGESLK